MRLRTKIAFSTCLAVLFCFQSLFAQIGLKEITITPHGTIVSITFSVHNYDILLNDKGVVKEIRFHTSSSSTFEINYYPDMIKTSGANTSDCHYQDSLIERIGNTEFRYEKKNSYMRIKEIANIEFEYFSTSTMGHRLEQVHNLSGWDVLEFDYMNEKGKIKYLGNTMFTYGAHDKNIATFEKRFFDEESPSIRIVLRNPLQVDAN